MAWVYLALVAAIPSGLVYWSCRTGKRRETASLCLSAAVIVFALMFAMGALHIMTAG